MYDHLSADGPTRRDHVARATGVTTIGNTSRWGAWAGVVAVVMLLGAWELSTRYWFAGELLGVWLQLYHGRFNLGTGFDGTLGWWVRPLGDWVK